MKISLLPHQDIYSGRELAHLATGIPYEQLTRKEITEVVQSLKIPDEYRVRYIRWPRGPVMSCVYILRNHARYAHEVKKRRLHLMRAHLKTLPIPPAARGDEMEGDPHTPEGGQQLELDF